MCHVGGGGGVAHKHAHAIATGPLLFLPKDNILPPISGVSALGSLLCNLHCYIHSAPVELKSHRTRGTLHWVIGSCWFRLSRKEKEALCSHLCRGECEE